MITQRLIRTTMAIAGLFLCSNHTLVARDIAKEYVSPRVKSIVVSPGSVNDDGSGVALLVQVEFVEPASADDVLRLTILPGRKNAGEAQWKDLKPIQVFQIHAKDTVAEVKATIHVTKNGTIGIKAETSSKEQNDSNIYWMSVILKGK